MPLPPKRRRAVAYDPPPRDLVGAHYQERGTFAPKDLAGQPMQRRRTGRATDFDPPAGNFTRWLVGLIGGEVYGAGLAAAASGPHVIRTPIDITGLSGFLTQRDTVNIMAAMAESLGGATPMVRDLNAVLGSTDANGRPMRGVSVWEIVQATSIDDGVSRRVRLRELVARGDPDARHAAAAEGLAVLMAGAHKLEPRNLEHAPAATKAARARMLNVFAAAAHALEAWAHDPAFQNNTYFYARDAAGRELFGDDACLVHPLTLAERDASARTVDVPTLPGVKRGAPVAPLFDRRTWTPSADQLTHAALNARFVAIPASPVADPYRFAHAQLTLSRETFIQGFWIDGRMYKAVQTVTTFVDTLQWYAAHDEDFIPRDVSPGSRANASGLLPKVAQTSGETVRSAADMAWLGARSLFR